MKPKILLATKVPFYFQKFLKKKEKLPYFQAQVFWIKALKKMGYLTKIFLYNKNFFLPQSFSLTVNQFCQRKIPAFYEKLRLTLNRFYFLNFQNYFRSFSLLKVVLSWRPDYLFLTGGISELLPFILKIIKKTGAKIVIFYGVSPKVGLTSAERKMLPLFDLVVTNDKYHVLEWRRLGAKQTQCLPYAGIDPFFHKRGKPIKKYFSDVCFVGTLTEDRQRKLVRLKKLLPKINLRVWGYIPPIIGLKDRLAPIYNGEAWGKKMVKIFNSAKIALNFQPKHMRIGGNMRTFEIPGCGCFQLTDKIDSSWFKLGKEVVIFENLKDLAKKISYYLKNESKRREIAEAGYRRTRKKDSYEDRFKELFAKMNVHA